MISQARMNIFGNIIRTVQSGISAGVISPDAGLIAASASLALMQARTNSACSINSASMPWTCRCASILVERAMAQPSATMNSALAKFLVEVWCMTCGIGPQGRDHAGPLHDNPGVGLLNDLGGEVLFLALDRARAVDLRVQQGVRHAQVMLAGMDVIGADIVGEALVGAAEFRRGGGEP